jgi:hypothetical protein
MYMPSKAQLFHVEVETTPRVSNRMTMQDQGTEAQACPSILSPPSFPLDDRLEHKSGTLGLLVTTVRNMSAYAARRISSRKCGVMTEGNAAEQRADLETAGFEVGAEPGAGCLVHETGDVFGCRVASASEPIHQVPHRCQEPRELRKWP